MHVKPILGALIAVIVVSATIGDRDVHAATSSKPAAAVASAQALAAARRATPGSSERLHLILRDGTDVRLRGNKLVSLSNTVDTSRLQAVLDGMPGLSVERLFRQSEASLAALKHDAEKHSGKKAPDLNLDFLVTLRKGGDISALADRLAALDLVADAYREPLPVAPPTADYSGYQGYRNAAPAGINVGAAAAFAGGTGDRVKIIDIEGSWNSYHEDLLKARNGFIANGIPAADSYADHGTAVLGELVGSNNGFGVTGIAPGSAVGMINAYTTSGNEVHNAILLAAQNLQPGDVILIEQHYPGPKAPNDGSQMGYLPAEYWSAPYDAIRTATAKGIIVVEAAGNGFQNLDDPTYAGYLNAGGRADSGAIMVGAGHAPGCGIARSRMDFSNYGSRVDVQGWGQCVTTTGYGYLSNASTNARYTDRFSGTSSASPIVAGAAALLSSVIEARTGVAPTPAQIRSLLKSTGTAQVTGTGTLGGNIGPMPDLARALQTTTSGDTTAPVVGTIGQGAAAGYLASSAKVPTKISWSATDASGVSTYALRVSVNGAAPTAVALPAATTRSIVLSLTPGATYTFGVAARDAAGNWSAWKNGVTFTPNLVSETSTLIRYSTGWTRAAYTPAIGGYVEVSPTTGALVTVTFTGRNIAWIGTKATSRGQAKVWLDGVYQGQIDLYSVTTYPSMVLFSRNVTAGATHTFQIQVVGTTGRPKLDIDGFAILK